MSHLLFQLFGKPFVIAVMEGNVLPLCISHSRISGSCRPHIAVISDINNGNLTDIAVNFFHKFHRAISRAVINNNDFKISVSLCQHAVHTTF